MLKRICSNTSPIEIWGGVECTVNRVRDAFKDQLIKSGHYARLHDLELFAGIGFKTVRYPILWEKVMLRKNTEPDWLWTDERLLKLQSLNVKPIAGLLHHGSGPVYTDLLDPEFPFLFKDYARKVAERYPWMEYFTPINEPLTTARFSALYGFWYPHLNDNLSFCKAFLNQIKAIKMAMEAIREVIPNAKLVQSEDLGKTFSTRMLAYQAEFENERRWLTFDMLCGKVMPGHAMWDFFLWAGIKKVELKEFYEDPCPPNIIGVNHYLSSERYLDHRLSLYPSHLHGGNGRHGYADIEAVRVGPLKIAGYETLLKETCKRYSLPVAVTEVHLGGTREEQLRWFYGAWEVTSKLKNKGYNVIAITAWALLGLYDWNSLLTQERDFYESGIFDVRGAMPRPTALAHLIKSLNEGSLNIHHLVKLPGWWQRAERILISQPNKKINTLPVDYSVTHLSTPLIISGASGNLGKAFARLCQLRGIPYRILKRVELDIACPGSISKAIKDYKPWAIINTAGYVDIDKAEGDSRQCFLENTEGPVNLALACTENNIRLLSFSSDLVFDGKQNKPYLEDHSRAPLSIYGLSKQKAEIEVLKINPKTLMIRTSGFFSPWDESNFITRAFMSIASKGKFLAPKDVFISPTYVPDLVNICLDLLIDGEHGIWNITNPSEISWAEFARRSAEIVGFNTRYIVPVSSDKMNFKAQRPKYSALSSKRGILLPSLEVAILKFDVEREVALL